MVLSREPGEEYQKAADEDCAILQLPPHRLSPLTKLVVIGATGHFGGRICRRLLGEPNTDLIVTSRSASAAESFANTLLQSRSDTPVRSAAIDQSSADFEADLAQLAPDIVIHTAGPYQGQDYRVAKACIECGSHYIDLADGREFVQEFGKLREEARAHDVLLVSGASTLPGLSSAVIDHLRDRFAEIHDIAISIAPAHQTPRGRGTIAAVLSYCGKPFSVLENGNWVTRYGWQDLRMQRYPKLGRRLSGACDVPDLGLLPEYVPGVKTVTFHAALEGTWEQMTLWNMAWLARSRIITGWDGCIESLQRLSDKLIKLGTDTGGMQMQLSGVEQNGKSKTLTWNLTARQNHGPEIPCTPALILARKLAAGQVGERGAHACLGLISLSEFDAEVSDLDIEWDVYGDIDR